MALTDKLSAIADAIRNKTGRTSSMTLAQMPDEIASIQTGGTSVQVKRGTFVFNGDILCVEVGFAPDIVVIKNPLVSAYNNSGKSYCTYNNICINYIENFGEYDSNNPFYDNYTESTAWYDYVSDYLYSIRSWRVSNGFQIDYFRRYGNGESPIAFTGTVEYVAYKFT